MRLDECYQLGHIIKRRGTSPTFEVFLDVSHPEEYNELESIFVEIDQKLVPFFISQTQVLTKQKAIVTFEDLNEDSAGQLNGKRIYLPLKLLPQLDNQHFYYHEILGFRVIDSNYGEIGTVEAVWDAPAQDILRVVMDEEEILVPLTDEVVNTIDREKNTLHITAPEGLIDLYRGSK